MIKLQDFAKQQGVTDRQIQRLLKKYEKELTGLFKRQGPNGTWLTDEACEFIRSKMKQTPIVVSEPSEELERLRAENERLHLKLEEKQDRIEVLQQQAAQFALQGAQIALLEADSSKAKAEAQEAVKTAQEAEKSAQEAQEALREAQAEIDRLRNAGLWQRIFGWGK